MSSNSSGGGCLGRPARCPWRGFATLAVLFGCTESLPPRADFAPPGADAGSIAPGFDASRLPAACADGTCSKGEPSSRCPAECSETGQLCSLEPCASGCESAKRACSCVASDCLDGGAPDGGGEPVPQATPRVAFAHYSFQRVAAPHVVGAESGLLARVDGLAAVLEGTFETQRGGSVRLVSDGSFTYAPPSEVAWGDDYFGFFDEAGAEAGRVRVSVHPGLVRGLRDQAPQLGNGYVVAGPPRVATDSASRYFGEEPTSVGDINGDGFDDFAATAPGISRAYVLFGGPNPEFLVVPSTSGTLPAEAGFVLDTSEVGRVSLSGGCDFNADGFGDLVVGSSAADGRLGFVVFGSEQPTALALPNLPPGRGVEIAISGDLDAGASSFLRAAAALGDVNGDGFDEVAFGASALRVPTTTELAVYVVRGRAGSASINVAAGFERRSGTNIVWGAESVANAGDVNGDGLDDVLVGAPLLESEPGVETGSAFVVFGERFPSDHELEALAAGQGGFAIRGSGAARNVGVRLAGAGDLNGDGLSDLLVGGQVAEEGTGERASAAHFVFGKADDTTAVDVGNLRNGGFSLVGAAGGAGIVQPVAGAGDFNGDGLSDVLLGGHEAFIANESGAAFLVFGKANTDDIAPTRLEASGPLGVTFLGTDSARTFIAGGGDMNRDGFSDLLVAGAWSDAFEGRLYVLFGWDASDRVQERRALLWGGRGVDTLEWSGEPLLRANGRHGRDTLVFSGSAAYLDLSGPESSRVESVEHIDLRGGGPAELLLDDAAVRRLPDNHLKAPAGLARTLVVTGDPGSDRVAMDLTGYAPGPTNAGRDTWVRQGGIYGLEITPGLLSVGE